MSSTTETKPMTTRNRCTRSRTPFRHRKSSSPYTKATSNKTASKSNPSPMPKRYPPSKYSSQQLTNNGRSVQNRPTMQNIPPTRITTTSSNRLKQDENYTNVPDDRIVPMPRKWTADKDIDADKSSLTAPPRSLNPEATAFYPRGNFSNTLGSKENGTKSHQVTNKQSRPTKVLRKKNGDNSDKTFNVSGQAKPFQKPIDKGQNSSRVSQNRTAKQGKTVQHKKSKAACIANRFAFWRSPTSKPKRVPSIQPSLPSNDNGFPTFYSCGVRVSVVDTKSKIFVADLAKPEVCDLILELTDNHVERMSAKGKTDQTWRKLYSYTEMDLPCCEVRYLREITDEMLRIITTIISNAFGAKDALNLRPRSWKEPHLLRYQKQRGQPSHTGIEMHYDGSHFTWQLMLSDSDEYQGGGTFFRGLRQTIRLKKGQVLIHPGNLYHKGVDITSGVRNLIVCFMDGFDPDVMDTSSTSGEEIQLERNVVII